MKEKVNYAIDRLKDALGRLKEGVSEAENELDKDGVIQRFEFTYEMLWKALKIYLEEHGVAAATPLQVGTPRGAFKEAFELGIIEDEEIFLDMIEDRNKTSHIYNKETSEEIFERIKSNYVTAVEKILDKLELAVKKDAS
jgi:nucleotidyltransferase substrate binding protein (TIGR01987 family)